jgi:O-antigen ligase
MERLIDSAPLALAVLAAGLVGLFVVDKFAWRREFVVGGLYVSQGLIQALATIAGAMAGLNVVEGTEPSGTKLWLLRLGTLMLLAVVAVGLLQASARRVRWPTSGRDLWAGAIGFITAMLLSEFLNGGVEQATVLFALAVTASLLAPRVDPAFIATTVKGLCGLYFLSCLAAAVVPFPGAWGPFSQSFLPGIDVRFQGTLAHPNDLGAIAVLYLVMEYARPSPRWLRWPMVGTAVVLLLLSQSKTAWVAGLFAALVQWAAGPAPRRNARIAAMVMGLGLFICTVGLALNVVGAESGQLFTGQQIEKVRTLTGRTELWVVGLRIWRESPLFGGGPGVFPEYAEASGQLWAGQAHNQLIGALAESGVVGAAALLAYVAILVRQARRHAVATRYASVSLVGLLLIRSITETPMDAFNLLHLTVFTMLLAWDYQARRAPAPALQGAASPSASGRWVPKRVSGRT